ncbi:MAG: uroporphyrinogen-III synthase [Propionicimonas sp.]|uniref:uroporphyrinogen-III synthase n=1 Tax=Propionicimonas sp. TaxID=1955623 RepID=UPI003D105B74
MDLAASKPRPLTGRRILVPDRLPAGTSEALEAAGADVVEAVFTWFEALAGDELEAALAENWDWLVVSSPRTVAALDAGRLAGVRVAAVGPATASALAAAGFAVDLVADGGGSALAAAFASGPGRVLLPGAAEHSAEPTAGLATKGWEVRNVAVYRTVPAALPEAVVSLWQEGGLDAVLVTAGSVARSAVASAGLPGPRVIALGEPSAAAARGVGLDVAAVAVRPDAASIADAALRALA